MKMQWLTPVGGLLGLLAGLFFSEQVSYSYIFGDIFISLLKVLLIPFVACSIFLAVAKNSNLSQLKQMSLKTFGYYFLTSALAAIVGLLMAQIFLSEIDVTSINFDPYEDQEFKSLSLSDFVSSFFSNNIFLSFADSKIVHVVIFSLLMGFGAVQLGSEKSQPILKLADSIYELLMIILKWVLMLAPLGVFALVAKTTAAIDFEIFKSLHSFFLATFMAALVHSVLVLPMIALLVGRFNPLKLFFQTKEALIVALSTASSSATLPVSIRCLEENAGVSQKTTSFVTPLGATINMDGSALYQSLVILLLAAIAGLDLSIAQQLSVFIFVMISSAGTAGIPGGGILMVGVALETIGVPLELLGIYLLVDSFWDYPITAVNVWGDLVGTKVVDNT